MAGDLSYRIELDSADAEQAFQRLEAASRSLLTSLEAVAAAASAGGLAAFSAGLGAAAAAAAGLTAGLFGMAKASAETVDTLEEMAVQVGSSVAEMSTLKSALVQLEANGGTLQRAFERLGNTIVDMQAKGQETAKSMRAVESASLGVAEAEAKLRALRTAGAGESASLDLREAEAKLRALRAGQQEIPQRLKKELELKRAAIAVDQARAAEQEAGAKKELDLQRQLLAVDEARAKAQEAIAKAAGQTGNKVDDFIQGLIKSSGTAAASLGELGGNMKDLSGETPQLRAVVFALADAFKDMEDKTLRMAIATKLFGRKDAKSMVEALSEGSKAIKEQEERAKSLGLVLTDADAVISKKFIAGMNRLGDAISIVSTQFGLLFQPSFTALLEGMAAALEKNRANVISWGQAIRDTVGPALESLGRVLSGEAIKGKDDWAVSFITSIKAVGTAASIVFKGLTVWFSGLLLAAELVAAGINKVFGTALNGLEILMVAVLGRLALAFGALLLGTGPVGLAILGIGLALGLLIQYWPQITAAAAAAWEAVKTGAQQAWDAVVKFVTTAPSNAWQWIKDTFQSVWDWIVAKVKQGLGIGGGLAAGGQVGGSAGFAGGGLLGGRGTGTSDSNLAWVSRGEFITPARAVAAPGVLAFLEALRRSGGNLRGVLDNMGRFALGGMIRAPVGIPAFAGGGMHNVTIAFPGLPDITGLRASSAVVDELRNAAAMAQVRSGGRKPSRYS